MEGRIQITPTPISIISWPKAGMRRKSVSTSAWRINLQHVDLRGRSWGQQFYDAIFTAADNDGKEDDGEEEGDGNGPTRMAYITHVVGMPWKLLLVGERFLRKFAEDPSKRSCNFSCGHHDKAGAALLAQEAEKNTFRRKDGWPFPRTLDLLRAGAQTQPSVLIQGDNKAVCQQLAGNYVTPRTVFDFDQLFSYILQWVNFGFHHGHHSFIIHRKCHFNTVADALANRCLDRGCDHLCWLADGLREVLQRIVHGQRVQLVGWLDGALRLGSNGAGGLHFQAVLQDQDGSTVHIRLLSESFS